MVEAHFEGLAADALVAVVFLDVDHVLDEGLHVLVLLLLGVFLAELLLVLVPLVEGLVDLLLQCPSPLGLESTPSAVLLPISSEKVKINR